MSLHTNGILTLASVDFRLINDGLYTFAGADPNVPNTLQVASSIDSKGTRNVKLERRLWLPADVNNKVGGYYRDYRVISIPQHTLMTDAVIIATAAQVAALNTAPFTAAIRRGEM